MEELVFDDQELFREVICGVLRQPCSEAEIVECRPQTCRIWACIGRAIVNSRLRTEMTVGLTVCTGKK